MRKLTKDDLKERDRLADELDKAHAEVETAVSWYNEKIAEIFPSVQEAIDNYNEVRDRVNDFTSGISTDIESYIDERSESWHETDAAQVMEDWKTIWDEEIEELEIEQPEDLEVPEDTPKGDYLRDKEESASELG